MTRELKCGRSYHGSVSGDVVEVYCRSCSRAATAESDIDERILIYHRWRVVGGQRVEKLPDREAIEPRRSATT